METAKRRLNRGQFRSGPDPRRHRFTTEECQRGYQAAIVSIVTRYPDAIGTDGRHIACDFLRVAGRKNKSQ